MKKLIIICLSIILILGIVFTVVKIISYQTKKELENELIVNITKVIDLYKEKSEYYQQLTDITDKIEDYYLSLYPDKEFNYNFGFKDIDLEKIKIDHPNRFEGINSLFEELKVKKAKENKIKGMDIKIEKLEKRIKELKNKLELN